MRLIRSMPFWAWLALICAVVSLALLLWLVLMQQQTGAPGTGKLLRASPASVAPETAPKVRLEGPGLAQAEHAYLLPSLQASDQNRQQLYLWSILNDLVSYQQEYLFLANGNKGLHVVRIPESGPMESVKQVKIPGKAWRLDLRRDGMLAVAAASGGAIVLNMQQPQRPWQAASRRFGGSSPDVLDVFWWQDLLLVSAGKQGLYVLRYDKARHRLKQLSHVPVEGFANGMARDGQMLYLAANNGGVYKVDLSNPRQPRVRAHWQDYGRVRYIAIKNNRMALVGSGNGVYLLAKQEEGRFEKVALVEQCKYSLAATFVDKDALLIADGFNGVARLRWSVDPSVQWQGRWSYQGRVAYVSKVKDTFYVAAGHSGLVSHVPGKTGHNPSTPASHRIDGRESMIARHRNLVAVAKQRGGIVLFSHTAGNEMQPEGRCDISPTVTSVAFLSRNWLVVASHGLGRSQGISGVYLVDISHPQQPQVADFCPLPDKAHHIQLQTHEGWVLAASHGGGLFALNKQGRELALQRQLPLPEEVLPFGICWHKDMVAIAAGQQGVLFYQWQPPQNWRQMAQLKPHWPAARFAFAWNVAVDGNYAYVANGRQGLQVVDVSQPVSPRVVSQVSLSSRVLNIWAQDSFAIALTRRNGLMAVALDRPDKPAVVGSLGGNQKQDMVWLSAQRLAVVNSYGLYPLAAPRLLPLQGWDSPESRLLQLPSLPEGLYRLRLQWSPGHELSQGVSLQVMSARAARGRSH